MTRMSRWSLVFGVVAIMGILPSVSMAQPERKERVCTGPRGELPAGPFRLSFKFNVGWEHGCSRSMESFGEVGTLDIEVGPKGEARLRLGIFHGHTFGPSLGEYKRGQRDFSHDDSRLRALWTGRIERTKTGFVLRFSKKEYTTELWGSDFKPEHTVNSSLTFTCLAGTVLLDPPLDSRKKEKEPAPECAPVVWCKPSVPVLSFQNERVRELSARLYREGHLPFAPAPGLDASIKWFYHSGWDYLHRSRN
jgi:hypothetical protein